MPNPTRHVLPRLLAVIAMGLALLVPSVAGAVSVQRLQGKPFAITLDCRAPAPADAQQVRIEAPPEGWPAWGQSVLVLDAPPGLVTFRRGDEARCGLSFDARSTDARLRSGVGTQFSAAPGSREAIIVTAPSNRWLGWAMTLRYGDPAAVQREDTLRFAIRVGGFAILAAMLLSSLLLFANVRDRASLVFAATIAAYALWIGLRTGLAAWPRPWIDSPAAVQFAILTLLPMALAGVWSVALTHSKVDRVFPKLAVTHRLAGGLAVAAIVAWFVWPAGRELVYPALRGIAAAMLLVLLPLLVLALHRGSRNALAVLIALLPPLVVVGPFYDGLLRPWRGEALLLSGAWFAITMTVAMSQRIGALRQQRDRMRALAERDALTGLPNRRALAEVLPRLIDEARAQARPLAVVFVDLDHFKAINDRHGHAVGDEVLVEAARRLADRLRGGEMAARHGGEEFVLLLPGADGQRAMAAAQRLRAALADTPFGTTVGPLSVTASFGVANLEPGAARRASSPAELLARADAAMYRAKQAGRNRVAGSEPA
ncbi:GGDEF domain-containing protein [Silanimonas sp.]|jgi:diguanylate cyclase (GGDEF)-like protein|uniref:GGDEF domain-containing protein n=1 Tax=Silanimonas sp. TaxID=1929290 RepID=UPI0037C7B22F